MSADDSWEDAGDEELSERVLLASLAESHSDLVTMVADLQATVERQQDALETVVEVLAAQDSISEEVLADAYRSGAEDGADAAAEKAAKLVKGRRDDQSEASRGPVDAEREYPPRGFD